ncbi:MAG: prepilin-type N-terminal cleavage/methylation domain-containing protein [Armatimonadetes bacterium]|nr:prepilin-type N-terminal cleavage/methylation domain-containing protein [Armatimonadota bacterium]
MSKATLFTTQRGGRGGFTLVEVLVVLAILVILFGLLFAPMMAGMDMASQGRIQSRLQDVARRAAEDVRRELLEAVFIYPPPSYLVGGTSVTDYSEIAFVPADTDAAGNVITPRRPRLFTYGGQSEYLVVRYCVKPPDTTSGRVYDETNPFVLMRQEGLYRWDAALGRYVFGSVDTTDGTFYAGRALSENSLSPREDYDIPATTTICLDDNTMHVGYVAECPNDNSTNLVYLHDDVKFQPERVMGEALAARENNTVFEARHGNWMGRPNNGSVVLTASLPQSESELQPRLLLYRWNGSAYNNIALDTYNSVPASQVLRWNSATGTVQLGDWRTVRVTVTNPAANLAAGEYYSLDIEGDTYNASGSGTQTQPVAPIYPKPPTEWGEPAVPIAYRINPEYSDGAGGTAKVVPQSIRVRWTSTFQGSVGPAQVAQYTPVQEVSQADLGRMEFSEFMPANQLWAETRLNRYDPPGPQQFDPTVRASLDEMWIEITYYYRRNFESTTSDYRDDVVYADYSTGDIVNITLIPQRYLELQPYRDGLPNLVVPPDLPLGGVPVRTQAVLLNARR